LLGYHFQEFIFCHAACPYKDALPDFFRKRCYPSTPQRPSYAFSEDVLKFFAKMYFKGPSSKVNFCNAIKSFLDDMELFSTSSNQENKV